MQWLMSPELYNLMIRLPIFCAIGASLILILLLGVSVVYFVIEVVKSSVKSTPMGEHPWANLARQNQLSFESEPGFLGLNSRRVAGTYRSHDIQLDLVVEGKNQNTVLSLLTNSAFTVPPLAVWPNEVPFTLDDLFKLIAPQDLPARWRGTISIDLPGHQVIYRQGGEEKEVAYLQAVFDLACDVLEGYAQAVDLGGVTVPALTELATTSHPLQLVAHQCLYRICQETQEQLAQRAAALLCPNCLVHPAERAIQIPWINELGYLLFTQRGPFAIRSSPFPWEKQGYYGCRQCGQSQEFLELEGCRAVVVLDEAATESITEQPGQLRINWFAYPQPFDFDEVEIIQADDEAVERFAVQLGNDTDPVRHPRYRQMRCRVTASCSLSANTVRILRRTFGEVEAAPNMPTRVIGLEEDESAFANQ
jgi:hypothetical protein